MCTHTSLVKHSRKTISCKIHWGFFAQNSYNFQAAPLPVLSCFFVSKQQNSQRNINPSILLEVQFCFPDSAHCQLPCLRYFKNKASTGIVLLLRDIFISLCCSLSEADTVLLKTNTLLPFNLDKYNV